MTTASILQQTYQKVCQKNGWQEDEQQLIIINYLSDVILKLPARNAWWSAFSLRNNMAYKGVYLHGPVGRGKTLLLDLAFNAANVSKKRWHFTAFMQLVHQTIKKFANTKTGQPIEAAAQHIASRYHLLMIDEFQVTEIADAMVLMRLFRIFVQQKTLVLLSSNVAPKNLYKNGLHYDRFLPFVTLIQKHYGIWQLNNDKNVDYRRQQLANASPNQPLENIFKQQLELEGKASIQLTVNQRKIIFEKATPSSVWLTFDEVCGVAWGAAEYQAIARCFEKVYLVKVPQMTAEDRDSARRFITLIDCLYDAKVTLYLQAAAAPENLYIDTNDNSLPFERTLSRLLEMQNQLATK